MEYFIYQTKSASNIEQMNAHYHSANEVYFLEEGSCKYFVGDKIFDMVKNDIVFIKKGMLHKTSYSSDFRKRRLMHFSNEYISENLVQPLEKLFEYGLYRIDNTKEIINILNKIDKETQRNDEYSKALVKGYFNEFLTYLVRNSAFIIERKVTMPELEDVIKYINENYPLGITLKDAAKRMCLSENYFSRYFKENTGFGFKEYINLLKINDAQFMLQNTNLSVTEIAFKCGFNDSNYFSSFFKEQTGYSPLNFKKLQTKKLRFM